MNAINRFARHGSVRVAVFALGFVFCVAALAPPLLPGGAANPSLTQLGPPSAEHWLGTDVNGRDLFYRLCIGARISLTVGLAGAAIALFVGTTYGLLAGYGGGRVDAVMMRAVDVLYSIPRLIFIIVLISLVETPFRRWLTQHWGATALPSYAKTIILILSLGLIEWLTMARIVRGQTLAIKNQQFILAARSLGQTHVKILWRHLLPNLAGVIAVYLTLTIPAVILDESFLSFLGLGVDASQASWGTLLNDGASQAVNPIRSAWWTLLFPAAAMSITLLSFNFLGDGLRDALDPRSE